LNFNSGINGSDKEELLKAEARVGKIDNAVPALMLGDGKDLGNSDGWRAQDSDTRTWKSMLTHAYGEKGTQCANHHRQGCRRRPRHIPLLDSKWLRHFG
jgi:hypothetical protein